MLVCNSKDKALNMAINLYEATSARLQVHMLPYSGFLSRERTSRISRFCGDSRKFSLRKSIFKQLDTALVGVVHWVNANSQKFSSAKETRYMIFTTVDSPVVQGSHLSSL